MLILANMWFQTLMRTFFFNVDKIVFNFISTIYDFLITIARTSVLSQADIIDMADRIYKLLAVFMVFKVTFSLIMYVVNPDDFSDKSKGVGKLGANIIISLCLLILTPFIFNYAYQLQTIILEDNSLATLIFGKEQDDASESPFESAGGKMAFITMTPFFTPNPAIDELHRCAQLMIDGKVNSECSGLIEQDGKYIDANIPESMFALTKGEKEGELNTKFTEQTLKNYVGGMDLGNLDTMFRQDMAIATNAKNTEYIMDYKYIFSTIVGIVVVLLLITFCMDVALRSIKLAFLQLIAPIPIISLVDPKSGKDGMFKKWYSMCFKTYISLFIRLLALYFMAYIVSRIDRMSDIVDGSYVSNSFVKIFVIIGALMFAKDFTKILEGLGIKLDGGGKFTLNPLRKMENQMAGGKYLKKPNDALTKFAKGGFGAKTFGKKMLSGANAAYHGKGFKNGFSRYKGGLGKWIDKQREAYLPYGFEASKERKKGKEELAAMDSKWKKGEEIYYRMRKKHIDDPFNSLDGTSESAYKAAGFSGEFLKSKMNLDEAKKGLKELNAEVQEKQAKGEATKDDFIALEKAQKKVKGLESVHESNRRVFRDQADIEDSFEFLKNNRINPVNSRETVEEAEVITPQPTAPQPTAPQPTAPQPTAPQPTDSGIITTPNYNSENSYFKERERQENQERATNEFDESVSEINEMLEKSNEIDDERVKKIEKLKLELKQLIEEKANAKEKYIIDEINSDIEKISREIKDLLGK